MPDVTTVDAIADLDGEVFGLPRTTLLRTYLDEGLPILGSGDGYIVAKPGDGGSEVGPGVLAHPDEHAARELLAAAVAACGGGPIEFAVPEEASAARAAAEALGFTPAFTARTMRHGPARHGGDPRRVLAVGGLEKG